MLEVNDVDVVDVSYFIYGDPPLQLTVKAKSKMPMAILRSKMLAKVKSKMLMAIPCSKLVEKPMSITPKLMAKPLAGCFDKGIANDVKVGVESHR